MRPASEMSRVHDDASRARERLDDRQERIGGERGRFVGVGVEDPWSGSCVDLIFLHLEETEETEGTVSQEERRKRRRTRVS